MPHLTTTSGITGNENKKKTTPFVPRLLILTLTLIHFRTPSQFSLDTVQYTTQQFIIIISIND